MADSVSRREFARRVGVTATVIRRLCARGMLPVDEDGKLPLPAAMEAYALVRATKASPPAAREESETETSPSPPAQHAEAIALDLTRKSLGVRLQELRIGRESGELVRRADVRREAEQVCGAIRSALLSLPARVSLLIEELIASESGEVRASKIRRLMEREIDQALEALYEHQTAEPIAATGGAR